MWLVICIVALHQIPSLAVKLTDEDWVQLNQLKRKYMFELPPDDKQIWKITANVSSWHVTPFDRQKKADKIKLLELLNKLQMMLIELESARQAESVAKVREMDWDSARSQLMDELKKFNKTMPNTPERAWTYIQTLDTWYAKEIQDIKLGKEMTKALLERLVKNMINHQEAVRIQNLKDRFLSSQQPLRKLTYEERKTLDKLILKAEDKVPSNQDGWTHYTNYTMKRTHYPRWMTDDDIISLMSLSTRRILDYQPISTKSHPAKTPVPHNIGAPRDTEHKQKTKREEGTSVVPIRSLYVDDPLAPPKPPRPDKEMIKVIRARISNVSSLPPPLPSKVTNYGKSPVLLSPFHEELEVSNRGFKIPPLGPYASVSTMRSPLLYSTHQVVTPSEMSHAHLQSLPTEYKEAERQTLRHARERPL